jgi:hypothetical protein
LPVLLGGVPAASKGPTPFARVQASARRLELRQPSQAGLPMMRSMYALRVTLTMMKWLSQIPTKKGPNFHLVQVEVQPNVRLVEEKQWQILPTPGHFPI